MARKPSNYWEKRSTQLMKDLEEDTQYTINNLINIYGQATNNINKEIEKVFKNYAKEGVLNKNTLLKLLNTKETEKYYENLLQVINNNIKDEKIKKKLITKYNAPAYSYRISRLQVLQDNIDIEMAKLAELEQKITETRYINTINNSYNHTIYNVQKGINLGFNFSQLNKKTLQMLLANKWIDNKNYSQRIWKNTEKLGNYLKVNFTANTLSGKSIQKISKELSNYMEVGMYNATTLVRTETNHFANEAEALAYEECEIEQYEFIATLDSRTCQTCGNLDNKKFKTKERITGINYPPMHPNDRCTTIPCIDEETIQSLKRRAKDSKGKSILVPNNMSYQEWTKQYAPETYKKHYSNLPKTLHVENGVLNKQLGYYNEGGELKFIPKNAIINSVHVIAGKGTQTMFRSAEKYSKLYGGNADEWMKKAGKIESEQYIFDVHWVEYNNVNYDFKLKGKTLK